MTMNRACIKDGSIPLPPEVLAEAGIPPDAELFITALNGMIFLTVTSSAFEEHANAFSRMMDERGISEEDLLKDFDKTREQVHRERYGGT